MKFLFFILFLFIGCATPKNSINKLNEPNRNPIVLQIASKNYNTNLENFIKNYLAKNKNIKIIEREEGIALVNDHVKRSMTKEEIEKNSINAEKYKKYLTDLLNVEGIFNYLNIELIYSLSTPIELDTIKYSFAKYRVPLKRFPPNIMTNQENKKDSIFLINVLDSIFLKEPN